MRASATLTRNPEPNPDPRGPWWNPFRNPDPLPRPYSGAGSGTRGTTLPQTLPPALPSVGALREASAPRPVPRVALTREEAAGALGVSLAHFKRHVQPHLRLILVRVLSACAGRRARALGRQRTRPWRAVSRVAEARDHRSPCCSFSRSRAVDSA